MWGVFVLQLNHLKKKLTYSKEISSWTDSRATRWKHVGWSQDGEVQVAACRVEQPKDHCGEDFNAFMCLSLKNTKDRTAHSSYRIFTNYKHNTRWRGSLFLVLDHFKEQFLPVGQPSGWYNTSFPKFKAMTMKRRKRTGLEVSETNLNAVTVN